MPEGVYLAEVKLIHCDFERMSFSEESQLIPNAERSRKSSYGKKAKMTGFPRIFGQRERGFLQRKERFLRQAWSKKRLEYDFSRQENEENLTDISNSLNDFERMSFSEESQLIPNAERSRKYSYGKKAKMTGFPRIFGQRERGFLQRKERFSRQAWSKKRLKYDFSRQENEKNLTDISNSLNNSEEIAHEEATNWYLNRNKRRRMAMCEQLEKLSCDGSQTLYDLRKALVVVKRLEDYGLL